MMDFHSENTNPTQLPNTYHFLSSSKKSSYPIIIEIEEVTYLDQNCHEHLADKIITYADKFKNY